jgi:serine protease inhibitor
MEGTPDGQRLSPRQTAFLVGVLFELLLILTPCLVSHDSWLSIETINFLALSHYPLFQFAQLVAPRSTFFAMLSGLIMALIWSYLFYWGWVWACRAVIRLKITRRAGRRIGFGVGFACVGLAGSMVVGAIHDTLRPFKGSPDVRTVVQGNTAFATDLYAKLKRKRGNLFFSPYSISIGFALIYSGSRGKTESEIAAAAHFTLSAEALNLTAGQLVYRMNSLQRWNRIKLYTANSVWCQKDYPFTQSFLDTARMDFRADARLVDFKRNPDAAAEQISAWIRNTTNGKSNGTPAPGQFTTDTRMVLCNSIYFKGKWATQFKVGNTKARLFMVDTNKTVTVQMMWQKAEFKTAYAEDSTLQLLELPYSGRELSMVVLLPSRWSYEFQADPGLASLEAKLDTEHLRSWLAKLDGAAPEKTFAGLPRFTFTRNIDLTKELPDMGMHSLFCTDANLSGMDASNYLYISEAIHQAFVEVNEAGTEAAAATWFEAKSKGITPQFVADHPFLFLIRDNATGSILFLGRIIDPTEA